MSEPKKPVVAIIVAPASSSSVLYGLYDVLLGAGVTYNDMVFGRPGNALLDVKIVSASGQPFRCAAGNVLIEWLRAMHRKGALLGSVCAGSLLLAEAGLLDGGSCAGHWAYRDLFREEYPRVHFNQNSVLNLDNEDRRIVTAGSVTAWQDLAVYVIARLCGLEQALKAVKVFLLSGHEDGQLPFAAMGRTVQKRDALVADSQVWIADNYTIANPIAVMAERAGLSRRTFARRFRLATGYLPMDYVHTLRIEEAKQILETEEGSVADIGARVGYEDPTFFRRLFRRKAGLTPAAYRRKFASALARVRIPAAARPQAPAFAEAIH